MCGIPGRSNAGVKLDFHELVVVPCACNPSTWRQGDQKFKTFLATQQIQYLSGTPKTLPQKRRNKWEEGKSRDVGQGTETKRKE